MAGPWEQYAEAEGPWSKYAPAQPSAKPQTSFAQDATQFGKNLLGGAVRGAGSIGATLLTPVDAAARALGVQNDFIGRADRRAQMDLALQDMGAQPDSLAYGGGKLLTEIAGTAGVGGALANTVGRVLPSVAARAPGVVEAIRTAGMTTGAPAAGVRGTVANLATRGAGGAIAGGASAGLVNPEDAGKGALIGGVAPTAIKAAGLVGQGVGSLVTGAAKNALGLSTGVGAEPIAQAVKAGQQGNRAFLDNMRGNVPMTDVLASAKEALTKMRVDRSAAYKSGMVDVASDKTVIDFAPIDKAVASLQSMGNFKGQVINKNSSGVVNEISDLVNQWKSLDPTEFHTPEGLDALKQAISDVRDTTQFGTAARKAADTAYNAVKNEITAQAPVYSKVMKDYSQASETLSEIERALSLGNKASADTSMRKLQSLMRNNVATNYGNRLDLTRTLENAGGVDLLPSIAGQAMTSATPRGITGQLGAGVTALSAFSNPLSAALLPLQSPRLVGEAAYGFGRLGGMAGDVAARGGNRLQQALGGSPALSALSNPDAAVQFGYRAAPLIGVGQ